MRTVILQDEPFATVQDLIEFLHALPAEAKHGYVTNHVGYPFDAVQLVETTLTDGSTVLDIRFR